MRHLEHRALHRGRREGLLGLPRRLGRLPTARRRSSTPRRSEHEAGRAILVVTSREFQWRDTTLTWLTKHGVPHDALYMRIVGDYRKDTVIKTDILEQIKADGFNVLAAWDDKPAVLDLWRENGIDVHAVG